MSTDTADDTLLKGLTIRNKRVQILDSKHPGDYLRNSKSDGGDPAPRSGRSRVTGSWSNRLGRF